MRVFLGNPPWRKENRLGVRAGSRWPFTQPIQQKENIPPYVPFPFYLAYGTAVLQRAGFDVLLVDAVAEGLTEEEFYRRIDTFKPDLALMETSTPSIADDLAVAQTIQGRSGARIAFAGPHASVFPEQLLKDHPWLHYVLMGEYEETLLELCEALKAKDLTKPLPGLSARLDDGSVVHGGARELVKDINWFPWPAREFLPMSHYRDDFASLANPNLQMWASRGCPYTCIFCLWPQVMYNGQNYRARTPEDVVAEMVDSVKKYDIKSVFFDDDTFNIGKPRLMKLAEEIKKQHLDVPWAMMARADLADAKTLTAMKEAGLYAAKYGIESGNQGIVDGAKKSLDLKKAEEGIKITKDLGIKVHLTFSVGLPGETWDTVRDTLEFALKMDPETLQVSINTPFPGTAYYKDATENGTLQVSGWGDYDGAATSVVRTAAMSGQELEKALHYLRDEWERHVVVRKVRNNPLHALSRAVRHPIKALQLVKGHLIPAS